MKPQRLHRGVCISSGRTFLSTASDAAHIATASGVAHSALSIALLADESDQQLALTHLTGSATLTTRKRCQ
jgi:hypothetical protein